MAAYSPLWGSRGRRFRPGHPAQPTAGLRLAPSKPMPRDASESGLPPHAGLSLVTTSRLLEYQLGLAHPVLLAAGTQVDEGEDGNHQHRDEHHQAPVDRAAAGERREVGLPDDDDTGRRRNQRNDRVQPRVELVP